MTQTIYAGVRLTHRYRDGWSGKDAWAPAFKFKMLGGRAVREGNGLDDEGAMLYHAVGDKHADQARQAQALHDTLSVSTCRRQYDCCGCRLKWARVRPLGRGRFSVLITSGRNY